MKYKSLFCFLLIALFYVVNPCYAENVETNISPENAALGDTVTLTYTLNGRLHSVTPDFSSLEKDFRILSTNYGSAINMINGVTSVQTVWRLTLTPKTTGELIIPEIQFGNTKSERQKLMVQANVSDTTTTNDSQTAPVFVKANISNLNPYVQSQVIYHFQLFYQIQLESPRIELPQIKDVTFMPLDEGKQYQTSIKGSDYFVVEKNFALFPQKTGKIIIPPARFQAVGYDGNSNMMVDPFAMVTPKQISLATKSFTLNVNNIPDQIHDAAWLPAKLVLLTENWSQHQWQVGNPVTRIITVKAHGLRADQIPDFTFDNIDGVNVYTDPPKRTNQVQGNMVVGMLEQKVTYIPDHSQSLTIPGLKLPWWNLETNSSALAQLNEVTVQINTAPQSSTAPIKHLSDIAAPMLAKPQEKIIEKNIEKPFYHSVWFWIATSLLTLWMVTLAWILKKRKTTTENFVPVQVNKSLNDKNFEQACQQGDATSAHQYLLAWGKSQWQDIPFNLEKLKAYIEDEAFQKELQQLEQAIYSKKSTSWNGSDLFAAYLKVKKHHTKSATNKAHSDPLPPLNP